ncbi:MAG: site-2 protease family protein [Candidatus Nanoarchaeia archaeon]
MARQFTIGRIAGIEIHLHYSWFFIFILLAWGLSSGYFPSQVPGGSQLTYIILGSISALFLFVSVLLHELAHSIVAKMCKLPVHGISLFFFGGISQIPDEKTKPGIEIAMAGAGPAFSLIFSSLLYLTIPFVTWPELQAVIGYLAIINLLLGMFNLMPAFPLDGGRILRAVLWWKTGNLDIATTAAAKSGKFFATMLIFLGIFGAFSGLAISSSVWFILIGGFIYVMAEASVEQVVIRKSLSKVTVADVIVKKPGHVEPSDTLKQVVETLFMHEPHEAYPVMERKKFIGVLRTKHLSATPKELRASMSVKEAMTKAKLKASPKDRVYPLLSKMIQKDQPLVPVYYNKRFVGIVRQADIVKYIRMQA